MGKIRVYELAKDLGVNSKDLLEKMQQIGLSAKNYMSTLEDKEIGQLQEALMKKEMPPSRPEKKPVAPKDVKSEKPALTSGTTTSGTGREKEAGAAGTIQRSAEQPERNRGSVKTAQASSPARPAPASGQARPTQTSSPARPAQASGPSKTAQASGPTRPAPASGQARPTQTSSPARPAQASGPSKTAPASSPARPAPASGQSRPTQTSSPARPAQTSGPSKTAPASGAAGPPRGKGPAGTVNKSGARPAGTAKTTRANTGTDITAASAKDSKVVVDREEYRKKALERREEQRRTQEQSQRKLLSKVVSLSARGKKRHKPPVRHHQQQQQQHQRQTATGILPKSIVIEEKVTVQDLANRLQVDPGAVIKKMIEMGVMATLNQAVEADTAALVAQEFGAEVEIEKSETILEAALEDTEDEEAALEMKPPVITVMGHVDHGKTSLLDAIRETNVIATEAGGITQHIGAYQVEHKSKKVTFLDTPGHEAFTSMRARGAQVTDIAVLVVAADDGVMPQTIEAINHAKAAGVPIVVAVNKIDKPQANPERVKQQLTEYGLVPEEWGGDTICVPVSASTKEGLEHLLEMLLLVAEMEELKSNPNRPARGTVIDARLDKGRGPLATVLIQKGALHVGDYALAGTAYGRVRAMLDFKGRRVKNAPPATPVEILGLSEVPNAGDPFYVLPDEKLARQIVEERVKAEAAAG